MREVIRALQDTHDGHIAELRDVQAIVRKRRLQNAAHLKAQHKKEGRVDFLSVLVKSEKQCCDDQIKELEQQVTELTFYLRTQQQIDRSPQRDELQQGHVLVEQRT